MASFISSGNPIVDYLNERKSKYGDMGQFEVSTELNVGAEALVFTKSIQTNKYNTITQVINQTLNIANEPIKLIILELKGKGTLTLDCDAFLIDVDRMNGKNYIESLNHVIIGKTYDVYTVIGYVEVANSYKVSTRPEFKRVVSQSTACTIFKLKITTGLCAVLPEIIKERIYTCVREYYKRNIPQHISDYYNPTTEEYKKQVIKENVRDDRAAEEEAAAEVKPEDKCDFKTLLKSKIKNESNEYCKVTDPGLLERIQQNIDGNKVDVNVRGLNDLINTRIKKVTDGDEDDDNEEAENKNNKKTISENKEAQMIREANEMFVISQQVLSELSKGTTYSSEKFFKQNLMTNATVTEEEENEADTVQENIQIEVAKVKEKQQNLKNVKGLGIKSFVFDRLRKYKKDASKPLAPEETEEAAREAAAPAPTIFKIVETAIKETKRAKRLAERNASKQPAPSSDITEATGATGATEATGATGAPAATGATGATGAPAAPAATGARGEQAVRVALEQQSAQVPGPKEVTPLPQPQNLKKVMKPRSKSNVNSFTYTG